MPTKDDQNTRSAANTINTAPLNLWEKRFATVILVFFTLLPAILIIGFWPDRLPGAKENIKPLYDAKIFHTRLVEICDEISYEEASALLVDTVSRKAVSDSAAAAADTSADTSDTEAAQVEQNAREQQQQTQAGDTSVVETSEGNLLVNGNCLTVKDESKYVHINTLLLILVALAGFLGNMIHVGTSFTTFLASGKFDRNWIMWYYVRPFTASALALGIYFVFRGGFLNMSGDILNINLYGVMTVSLLAGLFTDRATQKLKEVFDVLFKPKDERPGKLEGDFSITSVAPMEIEAGKENVLTITGEQLGTRKFTATINDEPVTVAVSGETEATVKYTIPSTQQDKTEFELVIKDESGKRYPFKLTLKSAAGDTEDDGEENDS